jgi:hypothetical protein
MIDQIANELMLSSMLMHTNNVSRIAEQIGYRPMLIITALYRAGDQGKFTYNKKQDTISISEDVSLGNLALTEAMTELTGLMEEFMLYLNREEKDMTVEEMQMLLAGVPDLHIKIAAYASDKLTTYELAQPKDKKSVYTFITLKENVDKQWGKKQFDNTKSKARTLADKVAAGKVEK